MDQIYHVTDQRHFALGNLDVKITTIDNQTLLWYEIIKTSDGSGIGMVVSGLEYQSRDSGLRNIIPGSIPGFFEIRNHKFIQFSQ